MNRSVFVGPFVAFTALLVSLSHPVLHSPNTAAVVVTAAAVEAAFMVVVDRTEVRLSRWRFPTEAAEFAAMKGGFRGGERRLSRRAVFEGGSEAVTRAAADLNLAAA